MSSRIFTKEPKGLTKHACYISKYIASHYVISNIIRNIRFPGIFKIKSQILKIIGNLNPNGLSLANSISIFHLLTKAKCIVKTENNNNNNNKLQNSMECREIWKPRTWIIKSWDIIDKPWLIKKHRENWCTNNSTSLHHKNHINKNII